MGARDKGCEQFYIFSATLSFALLALGLSSISASVGVMGFFVIIFRTGFPSSGRASARK